MIFEYVILDFESSECKVDLYILVERELELFNFLYNVDINIINDNIILSTEIDQLIELR